MSLEILWENCRIAQMSVFLCVCLFMCLLKEGGRMNEAVM